MKVLLKKVTLMHPPHRLHLQTINILIDKGVIQKISKSAISCDAKKVIEGGYVSAGWLDIGTHCGIPGFEQRESKASIIAGANAGGFTHIAPMPNLNPVSDNQTNIQFLKNQSQNESIEILPIGSVTKQNKGQDLAELYDMHKSGAIAFSSGIKGITDAGVLLRGLEYVKAFDGLIINCPLDCALSGNAQMHEGKINIQLGLQGSPSNYETIGLSRDLSIQQYANSKLLVHLITTSESYQLIKKSKKKDDRIFASVGYQYLVETDDSLLNFDSNYKVIPPLRSNEDKKALIKGIKDKTIDIICSNHLPLEQELKHREFAETSPGSIGLQTVFPLLNEQLTTHLNLEDWIPCLSINPYKVLGLNVPVIAKNEQANLTIFDPLSEYSFTSSENKSLSKNSPYLNRTFKGKVKAIIYKNKLKINQ